MKDQKPYPVFVIMCIIAALICTGLIWVILIIAKGSETVPERAICDTEIQHPYLEVSYMDDPSPYMESEMISQALIQALGTDREKEVWGFDASELIRIIANEGGDYYDVCYAVATCCFNTQKLHDNRWSPIDVCKNYQYDMEYRNKSHLAYENARLAVINVYAYGYLEESVGDATIFYAPNYCGPNTYHESQIFVAEIHGVRFFKER